MYSINLEEKTVMAKVFKGKIAIPGNKLNDFFNAMEEAEKDRQPFRDSLEKLNEDFADYLAKKYKKATIRKHFGIVDLFIDFICRYTDVEKLEEVTRGMVNSEFRSWWKRKVWDSTTDNERRVALKKFFTFLAGEKNIVNEKALKTLK